MAYGTVFYFSAGKLAYEIYNISLSNGLASADVVGFVVLSLAQKQSGGNPCNIIIEI